MKNSFAALGFHNRLILLVLPLTFAAASMLARQMGGPYWMWHLSDPSYFYLFDALSMSNWQWPVHTFHPGVPVQVLGALVLKAAHPFASEAERIAAVLDDPEGHLSLIGSVIIAIETVALYIVGVIALATCRFRILALMMQASPFLTMVIFKNSYHVKPESMLVITMLAFAAVSLLALQPGALDGKGKTRYAIAWGIIAGFGVVTKLTAAPIFLAPILLLGTVRSVAVYGLVSLMSFGVFILPAAGGLENFYAFAASTLGHTGAYGQGEAGFADWSTYPAALVQILKRPAAGVPVLFGLYALWITRRRIKSGKVYGVGESRLLMGIGFAVFAQALAVAKQPTANYMVPSYMLFAFSIVLVWRFVAKLDMGGEQCKIMGPRVFGTILALIIVASGARLVQQVAELDEFRANAMAPNAAQFEGCAQVYFFPASSPSFALHLGNWWTGKRYSDEIAKRVPANHFFFEQNVMEVHSSTAKQNLRDIAVDYPCLMLRGAHTGPIGKHLEQTIPTHALEQTCSTPQEAIFTSTGICNVTK